MDEDDVAKLEGMFRTSIWYCPHCGLKAGGFTDELLKGSIHCACMECGDQYIVTLNELTINKSKLLMVIAKEIV